jgi:hypothetical protein
MAIIDKPHDPRQRLAKYGMTPEEIDVWEALGGVAGRLLALPILHPGEREETVRDIQSLQARLLARPGLRVLGGV